MREIKLRQPIFNTDGSFREWHYWGYFKDEISGWVSKMPLRADNIGDSQQYTGLVFGVNQSQKDIWEGDIVASQRFPNAVIKYHEGRWVLEWKSDKVMSRFEIYDNHVWGYKVIGNICENPELINVRE